MQQLPIHYPKFLTAIKQTKPTEIPDAQSSSEQNASSVAALSEDTFQPQVVDQMKDFLIREDVNSFNEFKARMDELKKPLSLAGINLQKKKLAGVNLEGVDLTDADLRGTDLSNARLKKSVLLRIKFDDKTNWSMTSFDPSLPIEGLSLSKLKEHGLKVTSDDKYAVGYRTTRSVKGGYTYMPGQDYVSDIFSRDPESRQHGLYFYPSAELASQLHSGETVLEVKVPIGNQDASNILKVDKDFRAPALSVVRVVPFDEIQGAKDNK